MAKPAQVDSRRARSAAIARKVATSVGMRIAHKWAQHAAPKWAQHGAPRDESKFPPGLPYHIELALDTAGLPRL